MNGRVKLALALVVIAATCWNVRQAFGQSSGTNDMADAGRIVAKSGVAGGLVVCIGCGDAEFVAGLRANERYVVHALDDDPVKVSSLRESLADAKAYGPVSADVFDGDSLPYADNLANAIVVSGVACRVPEDEVLRVLAPGGVALLLDEKRAIHDTIRKPWPGNIDEWTHLLHGPDNNAVAKDAVVGPPSRLQWIADPVHLRSHEHLNSISAVVSARGRIFTIIDEGSVSTVTAPPEWRLVARDAFNGLLLWKQELGPWEGHFRLFRSGPAEIGRRLVAVGDRVYATLGYGKRVAAFDAATGKLVREYDGTDGAVEIVCADGNLYVVVGEVDLTPNEDPAKRYYPIPAPRRKGIVALDAATGKTQWSRRDADTAELMPTALAVAGGRVFFQNTRQVLCLNAATGDEAWRVDRPVYTKRLSWSAPTLVVAQGIVLSADGSSGGLKGGAPKGGGRVEWIMSDTDIRTHPMGDLVALDAKSGEKLWTSESLQGFCNPGDVLVIGDRVWSGANVAPRQVELDAALDLKTGEVKSRLKSKGLPIGGHTRCYRDKATERFLILGGTGVEFVKTDDWSWNGNYWVRGTCQYGVMPCNGLLYVPPDSCACRPEMRLHGYAAMAAEAGGGERRGRSGVGRRLVKGPAYGQLSSIAAFQHLSVPALQDWPTYRADTERSGASPASVPAELKKAWSTKIGGRLTSMTAAAGKVFVCCVDTHTVYALDSASGKVAWKRTVGGVVDSPPTIHGGVVVFGAHDGKVYCLRASDGELAWSFRASPGERLIVAHERVESAWPVHGSVLVREGLAWFMAGRSPYLDGGTRLCAVEVKSGKAVVDRRFDGLGPQEFCVAKPRKARTSAPVQPDILSASGGRVYSRWNGFDAQGSLIQTKQAHLFSATGFLDDTWWHRTYWQYGTWMRGGFGGWPQAGRAVPSGRIMVLGEGLLLGYGRLKYDPGNPKDVHAGHVGVVKDGYQDEGRIALGRNPYGLFAFPRPPAGAKPKRGPESWRMPMPIIVRAMVLADKTLFVAGPPADPEHRRLAELGANQPGVLQAVNAEDGTVLGECALDAAPILDGIIALPGRVLVSGVNGNVVCLE